MHRKMVVVPEDGDIRTKTPHNRRRSANMNYNNMVLISCGSDVDETSRVGFQAGNLPLELASKICRTMV